MHSKAEWHALVMKSELRLTSHPSPRPHPIDSDILQPLHNRTFSLLQHQQGTQEGHDLRHPSTQRHEAGPAVKQLNPTQEQHTRTTCTRCDTGPAWVVTNQIVDWASKNLGSRLACWRVLWEVVLCLAKTHSPQHLAADQHSVPLTQQPHHHHIHCAPTARLAMIIITRCASR